MKFGVALATLGLVAQGSAFVPSFNARQSFVGQTAVAHAAAPASTRQTRHVLNMVAAAPAVDTEVLTRVSAIPRRRYESASCARGVRVRRSCAALPAEVCPFYHARTLAIVDPRGHRDSCVECSVRAGSCVFASRDGMRCGRWRSWDRVAVGLRTVWRLRGGVSIPVSIDFLRQK